MAAADVYVTYPCVRAMLLIFNIAFWFCGLAVIWGGIWLHTDLQTYFKISTEYSYAAPLVLVTIGAIIIFIATLACTCIIKVQQTLLVVYGAFLIIILFTVITLSAYIYTYNDQLITGLSAGIREEIRYYDDPPTNHTNVIDFIQIKLQCCGAESYVDWSMRANKVVPLSCCRKPLSLCQTDDPQDLNQMGCTPKLKSFVNSNLTLVGATASAIALFPLFGIILTFSLAATAKKQGYEQII